MLDFTTIFLLLLLFSRSTMTIKLNELGDIANQSEDLEKNVEDRGFEDEVSLHENYRPKHKYKVGTGHQRLTKRLANVNNLEPTQDSQCAVLYKNNHPVGILQPFEDSYRFLAVRGDPTLVDIQPVPLRSKTILDVLYPNEFNDEHVEQKRSNSATFSDENYPSVFTKFQINNRLDKERVKDLTKKKSMFKRDDSKSVEEQVLDTSKSTDISNDGGSSGVEEKLKSLLEDMGLMDYSNEEIKREAEEHAEEQAEDENLELGTNKIDLIKEGKAELRHRRDDSLDLTLNSVLNDTDLSASSKLNETLDLKRSDDIDVNLKETKLVNKHHDQLFKRSNKDVQGLECTSINSEGSYKVSEYEKRVEREIRDKIKKLKEEVTNEIDNTEKNEDDSKRKKRQTANTLLDEETRDIDPNYNTEGNDKIHIRRKRNYIGEDYKIGYPNKNVSKSNSVFKRNILSKKMLGDKYKMIDITLKRKKRDIDATEFDKDEDQEFNDNEIAEDGSNAQDSKFTAVKYNKANCQCDKNDNYCECENNNPNSKLTNFDDDYENGNDFEFKSVSKKSVKQSCTCDKDGKNCKCDNGYNNQNFDDFENSNKDSKSISKKSVKQSCTCDKNGNNCKCGYQLLGTIPSIKNDYSGYNEYNEPVDDYNNEEVSQEVGSFNENNYVGDDEYRNDDSFNKFKKRSVKARKYADSEPFQNGEYLVDLEPEVYRLEPMDSSRNKRDNFEDLLTSHGGDSARRHLVAVRQRSMLPHSRYRRRIFKEDSNNEPRQLINMSDRDLFGALPQSFDGELLRYKRVRRSKKKK